MSMNMRDVRTMLDVRMFFSGIRRAPICMPKQRLLSPYESRQLRETKNKVLADPVLHLLYAFVFLQESRGRESVSF